MKKSLASVVFFVASEIIIKNKILLIISHRSSYPSLFSLAINSTDVVNPTSLKHLKLNGKTIHGIIILK